MGFWVFMLVMDLLIPVTMIGFGRKFLNNPPDKNKSAFGYRTSLSMKNKDTWELAHKTCGKLWLICGWLILPLTVVIFLLLIGRDTNTIGNVGGIVCAVQMLPLAGVIIPTEIALRKFFDKSGKRKYI